ncbi:hypothetical protein E1A91_A01G098000v1 [Gossypium mustelinum]|uniref:Vesicle transport protein n=1 Tax=Gossypium mustelinum TaxID=34275 RepID=A0A5D3AF26_GOSMU|nr:hypothetical protein E1A91_A01G098000v1 [Gossypium mustelinum]
MMRSREKKGHLFYQIGTHMLLQKKQKTELQLCLGLILSLLRGPPMILSLVPSMFMVLLPQKFAICFTLGCGFIIGSFFALRGPKNQLAHMSSKERLPFALGFIGSMAGTMYVSMVLHSYILSVLFSVVQVLALAYYAVSYFPGGSAGLKFLTSALTSSVSRCFGR